MEFPGFLGSLYAACKSEAMAAHPDTVVAYIPNTTNRMVYVRTDGAAIDWYVVNDVTSYIPGNKYGAFCGGDNPFSYIVNPRLDNGKVAVVVKDSYGNAFIPFLVDHYQYIYWFDYRYYSGSILTYAKEHSAADIFFINGISPISDTGLMERLRAVMQ